MTMNINPLNSQIPTQLYQNSQTGTTRSPQQNANQEAAPDAGAKVNISQRARELQTQRLQDRQEAAEAETTADNEQTEQTSNGGNQPRAAAGGARSSINVVA